MEKISNATHYDLINYMIHFRLFLRHNVLENTDITTYLNSGYNMNILSMDRSPDGRFFIEISYQKDDIDNIIKEILFRFLNSNEVVEKINICNDQKITDAYNAILSNETDDFGKHYLLSSLYELYKMSNDGQYYLYI